MLSYHVLSTNESKYMKFLRHVGTLRDTGHRVVIVFRQLPDEPNSCLVVETDSLPDRYHQTLMESLESITAQETMEFYEYAQRQFFHDGGNLLNTLHSKGWMRKIPTDRVIMRPRLDVEINLSKLNESIAQLAAGGTEVIETVTAQDQDVLDDKTLAKNFRSQAAIFLSQAAELTKQADKLDPPADAKKRARGPKAAEAVAGA